MENKEYSSEDVVRKVLAHVQKMLQEHKGKNDMAKNTAHNVEVKAEPNKVDEKQPHVEGEPAKEHAEHEAKESPAEEAAEHKEGQSEANEKDPKKEESKEFPKKDDKNKEIKKSEENDLNKSLFPKNIECSPVSASELKPSEKIKSDIARQMKWKAEDLKNMKDMVWSIKDELSDEAKEVLEKAFEKIKKEIEKLAKEYPEAMNKSEEFKMANKDLVKFVNKKHLK
jgi:hypothetical protein